MKVLVVILMASLTLVSQAFPHSAITLPRGHYHATSKLAVRNAASLTRERQTLAHSSAIVDESVKWTPSQLMSCIPEERRKKIRQQCEANNPDHSALVTPACFLYMMKAVDNATGAVDTAMLTLLTIEPTSLTPEQKISAARSLKMCTEPNSTLPTPSDFLLAAKNVTKEDFMKKYDNNNRATRVMICVAIALIENGCPSTSPTAALVNGAVDDKRTSNEEADDDHLLADIGRNPLT